MTIHEKRQAALREQIAQLEAENVAQKEWTLMGEADIRSRPQNSLLEEDLEFERVMKPVPVISEEVVQNLEQRIKARILENRFDDVVRIRPLEDRPFLPSRIIELQDTKSTQSLAQIYEKDYLAGQGGLDDRDGKLKKEHEEIEQQWENICSKLDALCNAHFVPKQVCPYSHSLQWDSNSCTAQSHDFDYFKRRYRIIGIDTTDCAGNDKYACSTRNIQPYIVRHTVTVRTCAK